MSHCDRFTIADVERDTGLAKDTLRMWERRYGFPAPERDQHGDRAYPRAQVERLRRIKQLLDQGYRPGKLVTLPDADLEALCRKAVPPPATEPPNAPALRAMLDLLRARRQPELRQRLAQDLQQCGLRRFVTEVAAPLTRMVGEAWAARDLAVFEEHLFSESLEAVLRSALASDQQQSDGLTDGPRVLLTSVPVERHRLGLLMVEAILGIEGAHCIALGPQTPLSEIVRAAKAYRADVVALSFSSATSPRTTLENIEELHARLAGEAVLWVGGDGAAAVRRHLVHARLFDLPDLGAAVAAWRRAARA